MKILFDTNVVLDVLLERHPHYPHSVRCMALVEKERIEGWVCSTTVTTLAYLIKSKLSIHEANNHLESLLSLYNVSTVNRQVLFDALDDGFSDYEDSVLHRSALANNLDGIVTRNKKDFKKSKLPVYTPVELLAIMNQLGQ